MSNAPDRHVTLFYNPQSRATSVRALLEELEADYSLEVLDLRSAKHRTAEFLAVNPMGKVPAIRHGEALVTESVAIFLYLADLYAEAGLAPAIGDPLRGPYLRWMVFYGSCFEPALIDKALKREPAPLSTSPYGDYEAVIATLTSQLEKGPYFLGERFSAVDVLWGMGLAWTVSFKLVPDLPVIRAYIERVGERAGVKRSRAKDAELIASLAVSA